MKSYYLFLAFVTVTVSLVGQGLIKAGLNQTRALGLQANHSDLAFVVSHAIVNKFCLFGFATMCAGVFCYFTLLYHVDISRALPAMGAMGYILILLFGHYFLREAVTAGQITGLVCLIVGIVLISK